MDFTWWVLIIWVASDIFVLLALGLVDLLMLDGDIRDHIGRTLRILMIVFGPIAIIAVMVWWLALLIRAFLKLLGHMVSG